MRYGARNQIKGTVSGIKQGSIMSEVFVDLPGGGKMTSVMAVDSLKEMELAEWTRSGLW